MYIDSHAHLFDKAFHNDVHDTIMRARDAGVGFIVVPGTNIKTSAEAIELSEKYEFIYACVGIHPHEALHATDKYIDEVESLSCHKKVVAIGEIGLDFHYDFSPRDKQAVVFREQIELAARRNLPIVVHTRESLNETKNIVFGVADQYSLWNRARTPSAHGIPFPRGVFHCFSGNAEDAAELFENGFFISYPGIVTFKNSPVSSVLRQIGCDNILLETDAPYMAPVPLRGKRNEPANIIHIGKYIAEFLKLPEEEVSRVTSLNSALLFNLGPVMGRSEVTG